jgi:hydroxymethylpyrimidine/phosphomethylpyrimidine kinase
MTHPQNVAGLGVDVRVAADYGVRHAMVVAAVSAQDGNGVQTVFPLPRDVVLSQMIAARMSDADVIRVGALGTVKHLELLGGCVCDEQVVIDPVVRSSAGGSLYVDDPAPMLTGIFGAPTIITPNIEEAQQLTGVSIASIDDMIRAGEQLLHQGVDVALVKGGHLPGEPVDVLVSEDGIEAFRDARLPQRMRGTGCRLAMALACELALGRDLVSAVKGARAYVRENLARS